MKPWLYRLGRGLCWLYLHLFFRVRVEGRAHIPPSGGVILCANHFDGRDPPALGAAVPVSRPVRFMAKAELFQNRLFGAIMRGVGAFPVKRGQPDRAALRTALDLLAAGEVFGIFPEGTRNRTGKLGKAEPGVAYIAARANCPVIPVAIISTYRLFSPLIVRIGKPIDMRMHREGRLTSESMERLAAEIMGSIASLMSGEELSPERVS